MQYNIIRAPKTMGKSMKKQRAFIYTIMHVASNKSYVGSTINVPKRWDRHVWLLKQNKHHSPKLQNSWNKYGPDAFVFEIVQELKSVTKEERIRAEALWAGKLGVFNSRPVTDDWSHFSASKSSKLKVKAATLKWRRENPEENEKVRQRNLKNWKDPETRQKWSLSIKNSMTDERCETRRKNAINQWKDPIKVILQKEALRLSWQRRLQQKTLDDILGIDVQTRRSRGNMANSSRVPFVRKRFEKNLTVLAQSKAMLFACVKVIGNTGTL